MKKMLTFAALASMMFVSCVNDESASLPEQRQMLSFSAPLMNTQTRGVVAGEITGVKYPDNEKFMIFSRMYSGTFNGWENTSNIANYFSVAGEEASKGTSYWTTPLTHYWPGGDYNLVFMAYSPSDMSEDATKVEFKNNGLSITKFETKDNVNEQYDLMYSSMMYGLNSTQHGADAVPVHFKHALSSITFSAQGSKEAKDVSYVIKGLKIMGTFYTAGNFIQNCTDFSKVPSGESKYPEDFGTVSWSFTGYEKEEITESKPYQPALPPAGVTITYEEPIRFAQNETAWLPIPQEVPDDARIILSFDVVNNSTQTTVSHNVELDLKLFTYTDGGYTGPITKWEMGKRYTYRIQFGGTKPIFFDPSITDWVTVPTAVYTLTGY